MDGPEAHCRCFRTICLIILCSFTAIKSETTVSSPLSGSMSTDLSATTMTTSPSPTTTKSSSTSETPGTSTTSTETMTISTTTTTIWTTPNGRCRTSRECDGERYCVFFRCVCLHGNISNGTHCVRVSKAGDNCDNTTECVQGAECNNSVCMCAKEFYETSEGQCDPRKKVDVSCETDEQCIVNAVCQNSTCQCAVDYLPLGDSCAPQAKYGQNCTEDNQCYGGNYKCSITSNVCVCVDGTFKYRNRCRNVSRLMPGNLGVTVHGSDTITVFWNLSLSCKECEYHIEYFSTPDDRKNTTTKQQTFKLTGLQSDQIYNISVQTVYNEAGQTPVRSEKVFINNRTLKSQVENLTFADITANSVMVSFDEPRNQISDIFRLQVTNTTSNETFCVQLNKTSSEDGCGTYKSTKNTCMVYMLPNNDKHIAYNLTDLKPSTNYNITVVMVTCNNGKPRESNPATINITTREEVRVENLNATSKGGQVCATWDPPTNYTGPLGYNVELMDNVTPERVNTTWLPKNSTMICFEERDLIGFWEYRFHVTANTSSGAGPKSLSNIVFTKRKAPVIDFTKVKITYVDDCYRRILINWTDPEPKERGTRIQRYEIYANNLQKVYHQNVSTTLSNANDTKYRRTRSQPYSIPIHVTPGLTYSFKIKIYDDKNTNYSSQGKKIKVPTGKPPSWNKRPTRISFTETTLTLNFYDTTLDGRNGSLIVIRSPATVVDASTIKDSWSVDGGRYRIPLSCVKRVSTHGRLILGADGDCSGIQQEKCNGQLAAGTGYSVMVFLCTSCGCIQSPSFGPYYTKEADNSLTIAVALVGVALFVGVTVVVAAFLWRFRKSEHLPLQLSMRPRVDLSRIPRERPVQLANMEAHVAELHADSNRLFSMHYEDIVRVSPKHTTHAANIDENKQKNRWVNVLPFDESRVKLSIIDDEETSDYINASYLPGYNWNKEYVASQGPLPGTVDDFWRMIWELNVSMIVMVTPIKENGKVKCEEYWPVECQEPKEYGNIVVENISFSSLNTYNVTIFKLRMGDEDDFRTVKHFHFLNWKDMSANVERSDVINFVRTVRSYLRPDMEGPMVVHCSAGVGRTGTFILLDYLIQFIENHDLDETVDIYGFILKLRDNRVLMVQTESQYVFIHDCAVQLVEEKREAMDKYSEDELLYVNTEIGVAQSEEDENAVIYENTENTSTSHLLQQTEL